MASQITKFEQGVDAAYEECVRKHGGFVLIQRKRGEFMLHDSECQHLGLSVNFKLPPEGRLWAKERRPLDEWATEQTGSKPLRCQNCM